jgi:hypothetical protein
MGATGQLRETWFWLGNEGRELLRLLGMPFKR